VDCDFPKILEQMSNLCSYLLHVRATLLDIILPHFVSPHLSLSLKPGWESWVLA
jgi:hypothetical protein